MGVKDMYRKTCTDCAFKIFFLDEGVAEVDDLSFKVQSRARQMPVILRLIPFACASHRLQSLLRLNSCQENVINAPKISQNNESWCCSHAKNF